MAAAAASIGTASGIRAWLGHRVSPEVARRAGFGLMVLAVLVAGLGFGGSG